MEFRYEASNWRTKETTYYVRIPVIIEINPTKSVASLTYFVYDIETL